MNELRRHFVLSVSDIAGLLDSYEKVIEIMGKNVLSLKPFEFSDFKKSLFIRLLKRETALMNSVHERVLYNEEILDKCLTVSAPMQKSRPSEKSMQHIQRLLTMANEDS